LGEVKKKYIIKGDLLLVPLRKVLVCKIILNSLTEYWNFFLKTVIHQLVSSLEVS